MNKVVFGLLLMCCLSGCDKQLLSRSPATADNDPSSVTAACHQEAEAWRLRMTNNYNSAAVKPDPDSNKGQIASLYKEADQVFQQCMTRHGLSASR